MFGNLGGWTGFILLVVVLVLVAGPKLPKFAKSIGESARIFKAEVNKMHESNNSESASHPTAQAGEDTSKQ